MSGAASPPRERLPALGSEESEEGRELLWDTEQADRYLDRYWEALISSEPFHPGETGVRSLRAGEGHVCDAWRSSGRRREAHLDALVAYELLAGAPVYSAAPVLPEQRSRTHRERMQQPASLAWLFGRVAMPLALFAQGAGAAAADTGRVHDAQAAIGALFAVHEQKATALLDTRASHRAGEESPLQ